MEGWGYVEGRLHPSGDLRGAWLGKRLCLEFLGMLDDSWSEPRLSVGWGAGGGGGRRSPSWDYWFILGFLGWLCSCGGRTTLRRTREISFWSSPALALRSKSLSLSGWILPTPCLFVPASPISQTLEKRSGGALTWGGCQMC